MDTDYPPVHILNALRSEACNNQIAFRPGLATKIIRALNSAGFEIVRKEN